MKRFFALGVPVGGFTLLELTLVCFLLALVFGGVLPTIKRQVDRMAVVAAREEVVGLFHQARAVAVARGGAIVFLTSQPPVVSLEWGEEVLVTTSLDEEYGVALTLSRGRGEARLDFDALGLGRVASQTLLLSRGGLETRLIVSSLGRLVRE